MSYRRFCRWSLLLLLPVLVAPVQAQEVVFTPAGVATPVPAAAFLRAPLMQVPQLNRAGTHVAALFSSGGETYELLVKELATDGQESFIGGSDVVQITAFHWLDDQHIAYNLTAINGSELGLMVVDINKPAEAYPIYQYGAARVVGVPEDSPMKPLVWVSVAGADRQPAVVELDATLNAGDFVDVRGTETDEAWAKVVQFNDDHILRIVPVPAGRSQLGYLPDYAGNLGFAYTAEADRVVLHVWDGAGWIPSPVDLANIDIVDVGNRVGELLVRLPSQDGTPAGIHFMDALTGEVGEMVLRDENYDFDGSIYRDPGTHSIVGATYDRSGPYVAWFDEGYRKLQGVLNDYFPGKLVRLVDGSTSGNMMLVAVTSDRQPIEYYSVDLAARKLGRLQGERPWLDAEQMRPTSVIKYRTADGKSLDAYVTLPAGASKESPVPLVVLPHGGPWMRTTWGFDPEVQLLASRGYAVLQPNYRGSTGYDWMFTADARVDFTMMRIDVSRAVKTVLRTGVIDPKRVAISGGGFGGYLAIASLADDPDLYRCGVTFSGVYDWSRLANNLGVDRERDPNYGALFELMGDPGRDAAKFAAMSPGTRVNQIRAKVLVAHQAGPESPEQKEADGLVQGLRAAGVPHEVLSVDGSLGVLENRVKLFDGIEAFLKANL